MAQDTPQIALVDGSSHCVANGPWSLGVLDDIGGAILSLFSEDNRWVNGQRIEISGDMFL